MIYSYTHTVKRIGKHQSYGPFSEDSDAAARWERGEGSGVPGVNGLLLFCIFWSYVV